MMRTRGGSFNAFLFVPAFAILLLLGGSARAQLPTQGAYSGKFGWWATGTPHEIDKAHVFWVGEFNGAFFNDSGHGFLHATSVVCPGFNDVVNGVSVASGGTAS